MNAVILAFMRRFASLVLLWLPYACSGGGCTGCGGAPVPYPNPPPAGGEIQPGVTHARLTENLLGFLRSHLPSLLGSFFVIEDGRAVYYLDETLFDPASDPFFLRDGCIGEPDEPCPTRSTPAEEAGPSLPSRIALDLANLSDALVFTWLPADSNGRPGIRFAATGVELFVDLGLVINIPELTGVAACRISDAGENAALHLAELSFDLRLGIDRSGAAPRFTSAVENVVVDLGGADDSALNLAIVPCDGSDDPTCVDPRCVGPYGNFGTPDCPGVCGLFDLFGQLGGFLTQVLSPLLDALAPSLANAVSDALLGALDQAPLGLETALDLGGLAGPLLSDTTPIHVVLSASDALDVRGSSPGRGLELILDAGFAAASPAVCATGAPADWASLAGPPPDYTGFVEIADDVTGSSHFEAYHAAVGLSEVMVNQLLYAVYQSGLLCQSFDAYQIEELTDHAFSLSAGLLMSLDARLTGLTDPAAPVLIALWAGAAPQVRLGVGGRVAEGIDEPLLEVTFNDLEISIYLQIDDAMTRLTGILTDVVVRFGVERTASQTLELVLDGIGLTDTRQIYNELAPEADLSGLLELIIDLALGPLLGDNARFALDVRDLLADAAGLPLYLRLNALRRDLGPTGARYLSLYATLCDEHEVADPTSATCFMPKRGGGRGLAFAARLGDPSSLYLPVQPPFDPERFAALPSGRAVLAVATADPARTVAHFRVDGGPWSTARAIGDGQLEVRSPRLRVLGEHHIEVRAVDLVHPELHSATEQVVVQVDRERPLLHLYRRGELLWVEVEELGSPESVELFVREVSPTTGAWTRFASPLRLPRTGTLEIVARDANGNTSLPAHLVLDAPSAAPISLTSPTERGCSATPGGWWLWLVPWLWRRHR